MGQAKLLQRGVDGLRLPGIGLWQHCLLRAQVEWERIDELLYGSSDGMGAAKGFLL